MKKVRLILPILTALFLLFPGVCANAEARVSKFAAGAESGKITIHLWDLKSLEGTVKVQAVDGGEIHLESVSVSSNDPGNTEICEASGNKVFMVSNGALIKTTITLDLSFVEDGEYLVTLSGGCTNKNGKYNAKGLYEEQSIIVGAPNTEEEEETSQETEDSSESQVAENKKTEATPQTTTTETATKTEDKEVKEESSTIVRKPQSTDEQDEDDEALKELVKEAEERAKKDKKSGSSLKLKNLWWIILLIIILIALPLVGYFLWKRKNAVEEEDYEGAATLDYDIEDDDIVDDEDYEDEEE